MRKDGADGELIGAETGFGRAVEFRDVGVDLSGEHGGGIFLAGGGEDHSEEALCFSRQVGADVGVEGAVVGRVVGVFDGEEVGVGAREEDVVEEGFVGADALEGFVEEEDVLLEGAAQDGEQG